MSNIAIPSDYLTPGTYIKINYGKGPSNAGSSRRSALYVGAKNSAGTATVNTKYRITSAAQALTLFGKSPLWWAIVNHLKVWTRGSVYAVCHAATSADGSYASATATVTIGTTATGPGNVTVTMFNEDAIVGFQKDQTAATIAANVSARINGMGWPVTASVSGTIVTVTSPIPGVSQNAIYRITGAITPGVGSTVAVSASTLVNGVDGETLEVTNLTAALAAVVNEPDYYIGVPAVSKDGTNLLLKAHILAKLQSNLSNRSRGYIACVDSKSAVRDLAVDNTNANFERMCLVGEPASEYDPAFLTGLAIGWTQAQEDTRRQVNMTQGANLAGVLWHHKPIRSNAARMSGDDINDLMTDGVWAIRSIGNSSFLNASLTTASKDTATGLINDRRKWSTHVVSIGDDIADRIEQFAGQTYQGYNLKDDTHEGTTLTTRRRRLVLTPSQFKAEALLGVIQDADDEDMLDHVNDIIIPSLYAGIDANNAMRLEASLDLRCIGIHMQTCVEMNEVSPG